MKRRGFVCLAVALFSAAAATAQTPTINAYSQTLDGTWEFAAEQTSPPPQFGFRGLFSFMPNGVVISTDETAFSGLAAPASPQALLQTTGQGQWVRLSDGEFAVNITKLSFNPLGRLAGWVRIRALVKYRGSPDVALATFKFDFYAANGQRVFSGEGTAQAQRMVIELP